MMKWVSENSIEIIDILMSEYKSTRYWPYVISREYNLGWITSFS